MENCKQEYVYSNETNIHNNGLYSTIIHYNRQ